MTTIKERVLQIAANKGQQKVAFFRELGLSYANFKGPQKSSALGSDSLVAILQQYPDISPAWLLMGEGEMLRVAAVPVQSLPEKETITTPAVEQLIQAQEKTIRSLERQIEFLERENKFLRKD